MIRFLQHTPLIIAFLGVSLVQKVRWEWRVAGSPPGPPAQCIEVRLPPLVGTDDGWLRMNPKLETEPASFIEGAEVDLYLVTGYAVGDGYTPGRNTSDGWQQGLIREVRPGITVACPPSLPLGTALYIEGFGVRICEDRGSAIVGKRLDVAFETPEEAIAWGRRWMGVIVLQ